MMSLETEPLPAEKKNILTNQQKDEIFEDMSDAILTVDEKGIITYVNPACYQVFHIDEHTLVGKSFAETFLHNKKNKEFNKLFDLCMHRNISPSKRKVKYDSGEESLMLSIDISLIHHDSSDKKQSQFEGMLILVDDITATQRLRTQERDFAMIFAGIIVCISIYLFTWSLCSNTLHLALSTNDYTMMIEGITILLFLEIIFCTSFRLRDIGLIPRRKRLKKNLKQTAMIYGIASIVLLLTKEILLLAKFPVKSYFIGGSSKGAQAYIFTAFLQEFLARGVIQTSVKHLMRIRYQKVFCILLTSLLFSLMHLPFGFPFMMGAFFLSIALGIVFEQQKSIWGCVFLHWSVGYLAMCLFF